MSEFNARVAEMIGWTFWQNRAINGIRQVLAVPPADRVSVGDMKQVDHHAWTGAWQMGSLPLFDTDANADYEVLVKVRETWDDVEQEMFVGELQDRMIERVKAHGLDWLMRYEIGDWSRAALAVKESADAN